MNSDYSRQYFNRSLKSILLLFGITIFTFLSCADNSQQQSATQPADSMLVHAVQQKINRSQGVPMSSEIVVNADSGVILLEGSSSNMLAKERAARLAGSVTGVRSVVNNLEISSQRSDEEINNDLGDAFQADQVTSDMNIDHSVQNGTVTLTGTADSWQELDLAENVAKSVRGVREVQNDIRVNINLERPDDEIAAEIREALRWDSRVDAGLISVQVENNRVIYTGTVGSVSEKDLVQELAYVSGANFVDATDLNVEPVERSQVQQIPETEPSDEEIESAIERAFTMDPRVSANSVSVEVTEGHATLTGVLNSVKAKRSAAQNARNTRGVWSVENAIQVTQTSEISDEEIETQIQEAISRDPYLNASNINYTVQNGEVRLSGQADTHFAKWEAGDVVARQPGVTGITNEIEVAQSEPLYDDVFYDWDPVTEDYAYIPVTQTDRQLREAVQYELEWSPWVQEDEIEVQAQDGVVTLTGAVDTWYERNKATDAAYAAGADEVNNNIEYGFGPAQM